MSRRLIGGELGALVGFIYAETDITPIYVSEDVVIYRKMKIVDDALARFGALKSVTVHYGRSIICLEAPKDL